MMIGTDGGFRVTFDRGDHWVLMKHAGAFGQFYHVAIDSRKPYWVYGGLQDNGSWGGPSMSLRDSGPINEDWIVVSGGDGFVCRVAPDDPDIVYAESQDGSTARHNLRTGEASRDPSGPRRSGRRRPRCPRRGQGRTARPPRRRRPEPPPTNAAAAEAGVVVAVVRAVAAGRWTPLQLEHAVHPLQPQPEHPVQRG